MPVPEWVSEGSVRKYHRAVAHFSSENAKRKANGEAVVETTDDMLKEHYTKNGGLVLGDPTTVRGVPPGSSTDAEERATTTQGKVPAKRATRKPKTTEEEPAQ